MTQNAINNSASSMDIDNVNIDGNTISSTDTNGNIILDPNGTGLVVVGDASSSNYISQLRSASGQWLNMDDATDSFGIYNNAGSPEGVVAADIGSLCTDTTNGELYIKQTDTVNTGWVQAGGQSGKVLQTVSDENSTYSTTTSQIPSDNTIPQQTEGTEILSVTITPSNTNNILSFSYTIFVGTSSVSSNVTSALFQDSTADALYAIGRNNPNATTTFFGMTGQYRMTAGTTSSTTFKLRFGANNANAIGLNGTSAGRLYGGVSISTLIVQELLP